jgi:signal transduction histidine kinase
VHHIRITLTFGETPFSRLDTPMQIGLYRIIQEALTNVARHAQAKTVSVIFDWDDPILRLVIQDDGQGFQSSNLNEQPSSHLGIEGMRHRASMLGGTLHVNSEPNKGTAIEVRLTLPASREELVENV